MSNVTEIKGDIFDALDGTVLIHACNCQGSWGKGIAEAFRARYPAAYRIYRTHCQALLNNPVHVEQPGPNSGLDGGSTPRKIPEGTALLIPPQIEDYQPSSSHSSFSSGRGRGRGGRGRGRGLGAGVKSSQPPTQSKKHWIACLFTSWHYGPRNRSPPERILANTVTAVQDLKEQLEARRVEGVEGEGKNASNGEWEEQEEKAGELFSCKINAGLFAVPWEQTREVLEKSGLKVTVVSPPGQ